MKSFLTIPALLAVGAVADYSSGWATWASASAWDSATSTGTWSDWTSTTYTATWSSGTWSSETSTWGSPAAVSYSSEGWTSTSETPVSTWSSSAAWATTSAATSVVVAAAATTTTPATYTGAAVKENAIGLGAIAVAGLAFVL